MMKTFTSLVAVCLLTAACTTTTPTRRQAPRNTFSSFDVPQGSNAVRNIAPGMIRWQEADFSQLLAFYQDLSGRTVLCAPNVTRNMKFTLRNEQPLNRIETLRLMDNLLAQYGATAVYVGDDVVKIVPSGEATREAPPIIDLPAELLPDSASYMQRDVTLRHLTADQAQAVVAPFSRLPNSVIAVKGARTLILRDYAANIRRMLHALELADVPGAMKK